MFITVCEKAVEMDAFSHCCFTEPSPGCRWFLLDGFYSVFTLLGDLRALPSPQLETVSGAMGKGERAQEIERPVSAPARLRMGQQSHVHRMR